MTLISRLLAVFDKRKRSNNIVSIQKNLVRSVSLIFGVIVLIVFLCVDQGMDRWVEKQFDNQLISNANYLKSQVSYSLNQLEMTFDQQVMPQYSRAKHPQFFQLWRGDKVIKRSDSLQRFPNTDLVKSHLPLGRDQVFPITMPNGEPGRMVLSTFVPKNATQDATPLYLTVYESVHSLNLLWIVDLLLISSFIIAMGLVFYITNVVIKRGLAPLRALNEELKHFRDLRESGEPITGFPNAKKPVKEIEPIRRELNAFIATNNQLVENEKRITTDIAHELKTPIAEILSLSEIHRLYPDDERISATFSSDILNISHRMKSIVENLMLLQRSSSPSLEISQEELCLNELCDSLISSLRFKYHDIDQRVQLRFTAFNTLEADRFIIETIVTNLLDNALFYGPQSSNVCLEWMTINKKRALRISNPIAKKISNEQLENLKQPLYQIDSARSSTQHFGLGLSIVDNLCRQCHYHLRFESPEPLRFAVIVELQ
ncbi:sensor histidine kinase [Vibrio nitrifigilis]|uniref:histidine kinase n=1 Tax=Vibrio nitrifigilis TaxID=2789781 RepID=A0ABS0GEV9_9VIBR|nr:HAMP domain-containing sensor histidine kinase [Vibrio nitrifigilis]MBF9000948.1 HAMP domain-containing histidine kinase [Vibrio nitrifigilis]